jgi:hypothetical protein
MTASTLTILSGFLLVAVLVLVGFVMRRGGRD